MSFQFCAEFKPTLLGSINFTVLTLTLDSSSVSGVALFCKEYEQDNDLKQNRLLAQLVKNLPVV